MTEQEAFNKIMDHLRKLEGRSLDDYHCVYGGDRCAIGALMTSEEVNKFGDYKGNVTNLLLQMEYVKHDSALMSLDIRFLNDMQVLHDQRKNWCATGFIGEDAAEFIAKIYGLVYTAPHQNKE